MKRFLSLLLTLLLRPRKPSSDQQGKVRRILVVRQHDQLGDMLCAVPLLGCLRRSYPDAELTLIASPVNHDIMRYHPFVDRLLLYDKQALRTSLPAALEFFRSLRRAHFDIAIVPATVSLSFTSEILAFISGAPVRLGSSSLNGRENDASPLHSSGVDLDWREETHVHQTDRNIAILGSSGDKCTDRSHVVGIASDELARAAEELQPLRTSFRYLIGFHPGAGKPENRWHAASFAALIEKVYSELNAAAVVTIGPMDASLRQTLIPLIKTPVKVYEGASIRKVAAVIAKLDAFVTNDTGIMHVAGGTGIPMLSLFGPTDPRQWAPRGPASKVMQSHSRDMKDLTLDDVYGVLLSLLQKSGNEPYRE